MSGTGSDVWVELFQKIDTDRDGVIHPADLRKHAANVNFKPEVFTQRWMKLFEEKNTGTITWSSFCEALGIKNRVYPPLSSANKVQIVREYDDTDAEVISEKVNGPVHSKPPESRNGKRSKKSTPKVEDDMLSDIIIETFVKKDQFSRRPDDQLFCKVYDTDMTSDMQEEVVNIALDELDENKSSIVKEVHIASRLNNKYGNHWTTHIGVNYKTDVKNFRDYMPGHKFCFSPDDGKTVVFIYKTKVPKPKDKVKSGYVALCCL